MPRTNRYIDPPRVLGWVVASQPPLQVAVQRHLIQRRLQHVVAVDHRRGQRARPVVVRAGHLAQHRQCIRLVVHHHIALAVGQRHQSGEVDRPGQVAAEPGPGQALQRLGIRPERVVVGQSARASPRRCHAATPCRHRCAPAARTPARRTPDAGRDRAAGARRARDRAESPSPPPTRSPTHQRRSPTMHTPAPAPTLRGSPRRGRARRTARARTRGGPACRSGRRGAGPPSPAPTRRRRELLGFGRQVRTRPAGGLLGRLGRGPDRVLRRQR